MASEKPLKTKVSITLDADLIERLRQLAEQDDRCFSQYINLVLKDHVRKTKISSNTESDVPESTIRQ